MPIALLTRHGLDGAAAVLAAPQWWLVVEWTRRHSGGWLDRHVGVGRWFVRALCTGEQVARAEAQARCIETMCGRPPEVWAGWALGLDIDTWPQDRRIERQARQYVDVAPWRAPDDPAECVELKDWLDAQRYFGPERRRDVRVPAGRHCVMAVPRWPAYTGPGRPFVTPQDGELEVAADLCEEAGHPAECEWLRRLARGGPGWLVVEREHYEDDEDFEVLEGEAPVSLHLDRESAEAVAQAIDLDRARTTPLGAFPLHELERVNLLELADPVDLDRPLDEGVERTRELLGLLDLHFARVVEVQLS